MNILISGGTGYIGTNIAKTLYAKGYSIAILGRNKNKIQNIFNNTTDAFDLNDLQNNSDIIKNKSFDCVINLSGEPIADKRWNQKIKSRIYNSRIETTRTIVNAINNKILQPKIFINASAIGYYGAHQDEELYENSPPGNDFLAKTCLDWENEALKASGNTKVIIIRNGHVIGKEGLIKRLYPFFKNYIGGSLGSGKQWLSWINIEDLVNIYVNEVEGISGSENTQLINATAPNPVRMQEFASTFAKVLNRPGFFTVPGFALKIVFGELAMAFLTGQKVLPGFLINNSFSFKYPTLDNSIRNIIES